MKGSIQGLTGSAAGTTLPVQEEKQLAAAVSKSSPWLWKSSIAVTSQASSCWLSLHGDGQGPVGDCCMSVNGR